MTAAVVVEGLVKRYDEHVVVSDVSFSVERGEIFGIVGPNGAGKTTTVECIQGLRQPDAGEISVLDLDPVRDASEVRRRIGAQLQESSLPDRMRVWEAVELFAAMRGGEADVDAVLERWGLAARRSAPFASLSGGQRQRLFVALALLNDPEIVFLDEMTTGLDPAARRVAWDLIAEIRERGTTVVLVTHFMDEAERLCDRIAVFSDGSIADIDTPQRLIRRHGGGVRFRFATPQAETDWILSVPGVAMCLDNGSIVRVWGADESLPRVCAGLMGRGEVPKRLRIEQGGLEEVYLELTDAGALA